MFRSWSRIPLSTHQAHEGAPKSEHQSQSGSNKKLNKKQAGTWICIHVENVWRRPEKLSRRGITDPRLRPHFNFDVRTLTTGYLNSWNIL